MDEKSSPPPPYVEQGYPPASSQQGYPPASQLQYGADYPAPAYTSAPNPAPYPTSAASPPYPTPGSNPAPYPPSGPSPYPQQGTYPTATTTTVITGTGVPFAPHFGEHPANVKCPYCQESIVTNANYVNGALAWIICASLAFAGLFLFIPWLFCCVPFCIPACQDVEHTCPKCNRMLGTYRRMN